MRVVNVRKEKCDVYIGRGSIWGNPYKIGKDGSREDVIAAYESYFRGKPALLALLPSLDGKRLGCYCKPSACHGDVLLKIREEQKERPPHD